MFIDAVECPECKSSHVVKFSKVPTRIGMKQRYRCQKCGRTFYAEQNTDKKRGS